MKRLGNALPILVIAGALFLSSLFIGTYWTGVLTQVVVLGVFASSLDILLGYTGLATLGHAAYFGISAYGTGIAVVNGSPSWLAISIGLAAGTLLAVIFGPLALRAAKAYFLMITLALAQIVWAAVFSLDNLTGGDNGLVGISRPAWGADGRLLESPHGFLGLTIGVAFVCVIAGLWFVDSHVGMALRAIRDNEERMNALGHHVWRLKYVAFVVSGFGASVAGVLYAYHTRFVSPEILSIPTSAEALLTVIVGGAGTFVGAFVGAAVIVVAQNLVSSFWDHWLFLLGLLYVATVLAAPRGLIRYATSMIPAAWLRRLHRRPGGAFRE